MLGENKAALQDSYYANYAALRPSFLPVVQRYCDFLVRYAALLYLDAGMDIGRTAAGGINEDVQFEAEDCVFSTDAEADTVWSMIRESGSRLNIQLVNLRGNNARWNEAKGRAAGCGEYPDPCAARPAGRRCVCRFAGRRKSVRGASAADLPADTAGPDLYG